MSWMPKLPPEVRKAFEEWGRQGGSRTSAAKKLANSQNAVKRWELWRLSPEAKKIARRNQRLAALKVERKETKTRFRLAKIKLLVLRPPPYRNAQLAKLNKRRKAALAKLKAKELELRRLALTHPEQDHVIGLRRTLETLRHTRREHQTE